MKIQGKQHYLWRAVDQDGEVVDVFLQLTGNQFGIADNQVTMYLIGTNSTIWPFGDSLDILINGSPTTILESGVSSSGGGVWDIGDLPNIAATDALGIRIDVIEILGTTTITRGLTRDLTG